MNILFLGKPRGFFCDIYKSNYSSRKCQGTPKKAPIWNYLEILTLVFFWNSHRSWRGGCWLLCNMSHIWGKSSFSRKYQENRKESENKVTLWVNMSRTTEEENLFTYYKSSTNLLTKKMSNFVLRFRQPVVPKRGVIYIPGIFMKILHIPHYLENDTLRFPEASGVMTKNI